MLVFLAGLGGATPDFITWVVENYPAFGGLLPYPKDNEVKKLVKSGVKTIMLDSGAYSAMTQGSHVDTDLLATFFRKYLDVSSYHVSLDVITGEGSVEKSKANYEVLREEFPDVIPTYHFGEPLQVLDYYCERAELVGLGGIAGVSSDWKKAVEFCEFIFSRKPDHKFHLFGVNDFRVVEKFPFFSCDATSWLNAGKYGILITPHGRFKMNEERLADKNRTPAVWQWLEEKHGFTKEQVMDPDFKWYQLNKVNVREIFEHLVEKDFSHLHDRVVTERMF